MAVEVKVIFQTAVVELLQSAHELVESFYFRVHPPVGIQELSVEVFAAVARSEISEHHPVGIHHRHHPKFMRFENLGIAVIR